MSVFFYVVTGAVTFYMFIYYGVFRVKRSCTSSVSLKGKTVVVTGSNTGIGKSTALDLAKRGARVILACRNRERATATVLDIRKESGNSQVLFMPMDLANFKSVRSFAETFLKTEPRLDILINNAGMMGPGHTEDGFGMAFGVNHLGHFLLTNLLLERLKQCGPSRVVTVSSVLHHLGCIDFALLESTKDLVSEQSAWQNFQAYCNSKLCNILFTRELANHLEGTAVTCFTLHPGVVYTELCRNINWWQQLLLIPIAKLFFLDADGGSQTTLHCSLQDGIESFSGRYFSNCGVQHIGVKGRDDSLAKKLWEVSERLTGFHTTLSCNAETR